MNRHERRAEKRFRESLRAYVAAGIPAKRGMSAKDYIAACIALWERCRTDKVYAVKMFVEPLVNTRFAEHSSDIFCVLIARCDPEGRLVDAPSNYRRHEEPGIFLSKVIIGSPYGVDPRRPPKSKVEKYLFAYFDILGFKSRLKTESLESVHQTYLRLIEDAVKPQQVEWAMSTARSPSGYVPALMHIPIEAAYASDSIVMYVPYHPNFIEELLRRAALLFCVALRSGVALRGDITFGQGAFHAKTSVFLGAPLVEASSLEQDLDWLGVVFGKSICDIDWHGLPIEAPGSNSIPVPPHLVQIISPSMGSRGESLFAGLVLDWPRIWRQSFDDSAIPYLAAMYDSAEKEGDLTPATCESVQRRLEHAAYFFAFSEINQNWCIPRGHRLITPNDVAANPLEGLDLSMLHCDPRYGGWHRRCSLRDDLERLKNWTKSIEPFDAEMDGSMRAII